MKLSDLKCKTAKSNGRTQKLSDGGGLYLQVSPKNDKKYWRLKYRFEGKDKCLALGVYNVVTVKDARNKAFAARRVLDAGVDPGAQRKQFKEITKIATEQSFEALARAWHAHHKARWADNTATNNLHRLETDVFPFIGAKMIDQIKVPDIVQAIRKIEERGAHELARRTLGLCNNVFRFAIAQGILNSHPISHVRPIDILKPSKKGHFASIESKQLPALVRAIRENKARLFLTTKLALEMMLLTFVRTSELIEAEWTEFDFENKVWLTPKAP